MTAAIIATVFVGALAGYFFMPAAFVDNAEHVLTVGLCLLLFMVGIDIGRQGTVLKDIRRNGLRIFAVPFLVLLGSFAGAAAVSPVVGLSLHDGSAVAAGLGWYSLAPVLISEHSAELGAVSFLSNIMRELMAIVSIPLVAKYVGYIEACAPAGAASMDTCLPLVEKATDSKTAVYSFVSGFVLTWIIPVLVPAIMSM